jgi:hypothetical protein
MNQDKRQIVASPEVIEAIRVIIGMNTMGGEERRLARREARALLKVWLYRNNLAQRIVVPKPATDSNTEEKVD